MKNTTARFYVGTQGKNDTSPIVLCELDLNTGQLTELSSFRKLKSPGYLCLSPDQKTLCAVTKDDHLASLSVDNDGQLKLRNRQPSEGENPCQVSVHPSGQMVFVANYNNGSAAAYPVSDDGELQPACFSEQYTGSGPNKDRQEKPHVHCALPTPDGRYLYVTDLGTDQVMNYRVDVANRKVSANPSQTSYTSRPGAGPRHLAVHPSGKYLFLMHEMEAILTSLAIDSEGVLTEIQTVNTIPSDFSEKNKGAAIRLHPTGAFVFVSNRGYDGITAFRIHENGTLDEVATVTEGIVFPRDFNIDPTGNFLIVANMHSNDLSVYAIDAQTGQLTFRQKELSIPTPTCIEFLQLPES
jgi:6-phosphogluconolactonase